MTRPRTGNRADLVPPSRTPLVMVFESQSKTMRLMNQGQRGTSIFLTPNPGGQSAEALRHARNGYEKQDDQPRCNHQDER